MLRPSFAHLHPLAQRAAAELWRAMVLLRLSGIFGLAGAFAFFLTVTTAPAQQPASKRPAEIVNQATGTYIDKNGLAASLSSTTVRAVLDAPQSSAKVTKTAAPAEPMMGAEVTFTIRVTRPASSPSAGVEAIIDGVAQTLLIVRDPIPPRTQLLRVSDSTGIELFHRSGDPLHTYSTAAPGDMREVDAVAIGCTVAEFPPAGTAQLRFTVRLAPDMAGPISNTAEFYAVESPGQPPARSLSNTVRFTPQRPLDPFGIVFDSKKNTPIAGARVTLIDASTGAPAQVFGTDGKAAPNSVVTGTDGRYSFPVVTPGSYRLEVLPPPEYVGPSTVAAGDLPGGRHVDAAASYGLGFVFDPSTGPFEFDLPLDRIAAQATGLFVQKTASRQFAEIGDFVDYTVRVKNVSGRVLEDVILDDTLPHGFSFEPGSARLGNGGRLRSASGDRGPRLKFSLGALAADEIIALSYRAKLGPDARQGDGINRAQARNQGAPRALSNVATAQVLIEEGVFTTRGVIVGKVFADANRNRLQDYGEPGVPGVRIYMEDGSYVVTDGDGKYDFYGVTPRLHVLKVDKTTLPPGAELAVLDSRHAGKPGTRFVDLKNSEMHKANFAIGNVTPDILAHIEKLKAAVRKLTGENDRALRADLTRDGAPLYGADTDRRTLPASGTIVPGVSVQPTQDVRTEAGGSLILGDSRLGTSILPNGNDPRRPDAPLFGEFTARQDRTLRSSGSSTTTPASEVSKRPAPQPASAPLAPSSVPAAPPRQPEAVKVQPAPAAMVLPMHPAVTSSPEADGSAPEAQSGTFVPVVEPPVFESRRGVNPASASFESVMPSLPGEGVNLALFDVSDAASAPTVPAIPLEVAATTAPVVAATAPSRTSLVTGPHLGDASKFGFIDLKEGDTLPMAQANIRVKGGAGAKLVLKVNGEAVSERRIGKKTTIPERGIEALEFIGVALRPGANTLELSQVDPFGNPRGTSAITVTAPDKLGRIAIELPAAELAADGRTPARIGVRLTDAAGVPVTARTELTLEATLGHWDTRDLNPASPGVQTFIEGGRAEFLLGAPVEPGDCRIRVSSGLLGDEAKLAWLPDLRPMLAVGLVEGRINVTNFNAGKLTGIDQSDAFEQELRELSVGNNEQSAAARAAFFLKGKIKGDYLLTAAYDSEREVRERLFRDIQPDEFYPVYGDSAVKGFEAQSTGPLYVRIDKKRSYLLYGDYVTQSTTSDFRQLGTYNRSLTGVKQHFETGRVSANAWAAYDSTKQIIEELRANGTSGPYFFNIRAGRGLTNSEKVELLIRDRDNPGLIIKTEPKTRFADYEFEPFTGRILFRAPIPSLDADLNPVSIRVTYEADTGGPKFWTWGADAQVKITERFEIGGAVAREESPVNRYGIYSANAVFEVARNTFLLGEWAHSEDELLGSGDAYRFELRHQSERAAARIFWGRADATFHNPAAVLQSGRTEGGAQIAVKLAPKTRLLIEGVTTESEAGGERRGVMAAVEQTFGKDVRVEVGGRWSRESGGAATPGSATNFLQAGGDSLRNEDHEVRSLRAKVSLPMPFTDGAARVFGEYEQDITDSEKRMAAFGGEYQLDPKTRLYARHEFISSLGGPFELNTTSQNNNTVIGVESTYMKDAQLFNEYRARNGFSGREAESAIGLRNQWPIAPGLRAQTSFERVSPLSGSILSESTAITGALEYTANPDWKGTARLELRKSDATDSLLNTLGVAWKISPDFTALGRSILYIADNKGPSAGRQTQARLQLGLAWRQSTTDKWHALAKYEFKTEDDATKQDFDVKRHVHILSADVNYQPTASLFLSGHYAGKLVDDRSNGSDSATTAHLVSGRAIYDVTEKFDVGLNASALLSEGAVRYGLGPEVGYTLADNLRAGVGYNFIGFDDPDLSEDQYTQKGVYLALKWKFDEETFQRPKRREEEQTK